MQPGTLKKLKLTLPEGAELNGIGELDDVAIDLGTVISARAVLAYDERDGGARRLHLYRPDGEYLPVKGHHRRVNPGWFEDNHGEFVNGLNQYCYIPGECEVDLP